MISKDYLSKASDWKARDREADEAILFGCAKETPRRGPRPKPKQLTLKEVMQ